MMTEEQLQQFISDPQRVGTLSTANAEGIPNCALIGSAIMPATDQLVLGLGNNRSLRNLRENPTAVFTVFQAAEILPAWQGARLYLKVEQIDDGGALKQQMVEQIEAVVGKQAAKMIVAAVKFSVYAIRPLLD